MGRMEAIRMGKYVGCLRFLNAENMHLKKNISAGLPNGRRTRVRAGRNETRRVEVS
jgi:hypothetical protein